MSSIGSVKSEVILHKYQTPCPSISNKRQPNASVSRIPSRSSVAITKTKSIKRQQQQDVGDGSDRRYTSSNEKMAAMRVVHNTPENSPECSALQDRKELSKICCFMNICQERPWTERVHTEGRGLLMMLRLFFEAITIFVIYVLFGEAVVAFWRRFVSNRSYSEDVITPRL
ncbi:uncharacterized protein LOC118456143 [Anopheles albimanus]|uniref:uncharacterized protein LOC118456143 n=1 Tax=Anopheles albimanus TaxID=7167 RepID=UPI00163EE773|nr:uncharacterized protein LOC118456143 [Anopheles albimanus]